MIEATAQHEAAADAVRKTLEPEPWPRLRMYARIFGREAVMNNRAAFLDVRPNTNAATATRTAKQAWAEVEALRALTPAEAVERIERTRAAEHVAREAAVRAREARRRELSASDPRHNRPTLGR